MIDANYPSLSRAIASSWLWAIATAAADAIAAAWSTSVTKRWLGDASSLWNVATISRMLLIAAVVSTLVQFAIPAYVRSGLPIAWPLTLLALMTAIATWPSAFERAWRRSAITRMLSTPHDR